MKRVCAWCQIELGTIDSSIHSKDATTHGICDACTTKKIRAMARKE
jgi:hypothetical protein